MFRSGDLLQTVIQLRPKPTDKVNKIYNPTMYAKNRMQDMLTWWGCSQEHTSVSQYVHMMNEEWKQNTIEGQKNSMMNTLIKTEM